MGLFCGYLLQIYRAFWHIYGAITFRRKSRGTYVLASKKRRIRGKSPYLLCIWMCVRYSGLCFKKKKMFHVSVSAESRCTCCVCGRVCGILGFVLYFFVETCFRMCLRSEAYKSCVRYVGLCFVFLPHTQEIQNKALHTAHTTHTETCFRFFVCHVCAVFRALFCIFLCHVSVCV